MDMILILVMVMIELKREFDPRRRPSSNHSPNRITSKNRVASSSHFPPPNSVKTFPLMSNYALRLRTRQINFRPAISSTKLRLSPTAQSSQRLSPSSIRTYVSGQQRQPSYQPLKIWPIILITLLGSASYVYMVKSRVNTDGPRKPRGPTITPP